MLDIDWDNPRVLISPRRRMLLAERDNRERLARSKLRQAKGPKNHATNRERSHAERLKALEARLAADKKATASATYHAAVREYWSGARENHP